MSRGEKEIGSKARIAGKIIYPKKGMHDQK